MKPISSERQRRERPPPDIRIVPFWGIGDSISAADWIHLYDSIASDHGYSSTNKLVRLGGHLRKHALVWFAEVTRQPQIQAADWPTFKEMFVKYFTNDLSINDFSDVSSTLSSVG